MNALRSYFLQIVQSSWFIPVLFGGLGVFVWVECQIRNDFDIFLAASRDVWQKKAIFNEVYFDGYHYYYSVFFAILLSPFNSLPPEVAKAIWIVCNMVLCWSIIRITVRYLEPYRGMKVWSAFFIGTLLFFSLRLIRGNLHLGQMTILMLFGSLCALDWIWKGKPFKGGALLALVINIKLMPLVIVPYLVYRAQWKAVVATLFWLAVFFTIPYVWLETAYYNQLMADWWALVNPVHDKHVLDVDETSFHGLSTLLATLLVAELPAHGALDVKRNIADVSLSQLHTIVTLVRIVFIAWTLWFLRSMPFQMENSIMKRWWEWSYILLVTPLIFPHQQHYAFLMAMPAMAYVLRWFFQTEREEPGRQWRWILFAIVILVFNLSLWLGAYIAFYNHFKILTYAAIALVVLLSSIPPHRQAEPVSILRT